MKDGFGVLFAFSSDRFLSFWDNILSDVLQNYLN